MCLVDFHVYRFSAARTDVCTPSAHSRNEANDSFGREVVCVLVFERVGAAQIHAVQVWLARLHLQIAHLSFLCTSALSAFGEGRSIAAL